MHPSWLAIIPNLQLFQAHARWSQKLPNGFIDPFSPKLEIPRFDRLVMRRIVINVELVESTDLGLQLPTIDCRDTGPMQLLGIGPFPLLQTLLD